MKCPLCSGEELETGIWEVPFTFKGHETKLQAKGDYCSACKEVIMSGEESDLLQGRVNEFKTRTIEEHR